MSAPGPISGANPHTGTYQTEQYDTTVPPAESPLHALQTAPGAPSAGAFPGSNSLNSQASPAKVFAARDNPPPGAGGNPGGIDL